MKQTDGGFAPSYNVKVNTDAKHALVSLPVLKWRKIPV
jgi:hypothetical protein